MKKYIILILFLFAGSQYSCKKSFLDEKPLDFLGTANALVTYSDYNLLVNDLYRLVRLEFFSRDERYPFDYIYSTDLVFDGQASTDRHTNMTAAFNPTGGLASTHWNAFYKIISESNTIISRAPGSGLSDSQKSLVIAKAKFFRALSYRSLAYLYGGVPLSLEEVAGPKTDFVRATKEEVLNQCILDLSEAAANLPSIQTVLDGEINSQVANHLLSEVLLAVGKFQESVNAASAVINSGVVGLMKNRFGAKSTVATGNVYWDLFQQGNQNRKSGNLEGLMVIQFETDLPGGSVLSTNGSPGGYQLERQHAPGLSLAVSGGNSPFLWPLSDLSGGRGIGWAVSTNYFMNTIWESDFNNDIRNANINFVRQFKANNPSNGLFGQTINVASPPPGITVPSRALYAYQAKATTPGGHPANLIQDASIGLLRNTAGATYLDQYLFRLAETYLIRAEAYMKLGDLNRAATDINVVRSRSNASNVSSANVTIDYLLDERMRELGVEEKRKLTLMRLGLLFDRVKKYNPYYADVDPKFNLWPIPASEIERNKDAVLTQNPGY